MAFNLNKSSSKFNLAKNNAGDGEQRAKKASYWAWGILALAAVGGGMWYVSSGSVTLKPNDSASVLSGRDKGTAADSQKAPSKATDSSAARPEKPSGSLPGSITVAAFFKPGSAALTGLSKNMVKDLLDLSGSKKSGVIRINGYASSEGPLAVNQTISQSRADAFKKYLVSKGIAESKIIAAGKGIDNPVASNDTEEGRQKNRRVEVITE